MFPTWRPHWLRPVVALLAFGCVTPITFSRSDYCRR